MIPSCAYCLTFTKYSVVNDFLCLKAFKDAKLPHKQTTQLFDVYHSINDNANNIIDNRKIYCKNYTFKFHCMGGFHSESHG